MRKTLQVHSGKNRQISSFSSDDLRSVAPFVKGTGIEYEHVQEAVNRGLITIELADAFAMTAFLSRTVLAAQNAQRRCGIPASVLIAIAVLHSAWDADRLGGRSRLIERDAPDGRPSPKVELWFLKKARSLATSPRFREALPLLNDAKAYISHLCSLGFGTKSDAEDIFSLIERYGLEQCDLAGILRPGEFHKSKFRGERDGSGAMQLKPAIDLREVAQMYQEAVSAA